MKTDKQSAKTSDGKKNASSAKTTKTEAATSEYTSGSAPNPVLSMIPDMGKQVIFNLTDEQRIRLGGNHFDPAKGISEGSKQAPATITSVFSGKNGVVVNLRVHPDSSGNDLWVKYVSQGNDPGHWNWGK